MSEIEISINNAYVGIDKSVQPLLDEFEQRYHAHASLIVYDWGVAWTEFLKISLYQHGPVISQTGNSWMGSLIAQNNLRAFKDQEIAGLGGQDRFLPGSWESCLDFDNEQVVAIPWILDTYLVYYHRDQLAKAGIDAAGAFSTPEDFHATLQKLQDAGTQYPFAVPTVKSNSNIHTAASWVWGQGGDFIDAEGTQVLLNRPETRKGLKLYFDLYRFISPEAQELNDRECWEWFLDGKIAVTVRNPGLLFRLDKKEFPEAFAANIGAATMPGVPLLGGSNLVVWKHIQPEMEKDAVELVKFLTSPDVQLNLLENTGRIPANVQALERIPSTSFFGPFVQSMRKARPFPRIRMWGLVEDKLVNVLSQTWKTLLTTSNPDVEQVIASHLDPIEARLNLALSQ
jgi:ABC-type glycerol-3-phosphate transport system substrate-binding protein